MKTMKFWKKILILVAVMFVLALFAHVYVQFSGPFGNASTEYRKRFASEDIKQIRLCKLCRKNFSIQSGSHRLRFSILVTESQAEREVKVTYTKYTGDKKYDIEFDK